MVNAKIIIMIFRWSHGQVMMVMKLIYSIARRKICKQSPLHGSQNFKLVEVLRHVKDIKILMSLIAQWLERNFGVDSDPNGRGSIPRRRRLKPYFFKSQMPRCSYGENIMILF